MASLIQRIGRHSLLAFTRDPMISSELRETHLQKLEHLITTVTSDDLAIAPALFQDTLAQNGRAASQAPVKYLLIFENADVNICVFILRRGVRMPMHDHPGMHGLLKVVHGCIKVQSYSLLNELGPHNLQAATMHPPVVRRAEDPPLSLTPHSENLHEIESVDGTAAFLDILSPPYGEDSRLGIERDCHYYERVDDGGLDSAKVWLNRIPSPIEFWCDQAHYRGPPLAGVIEHGNP